MNLRNTFLKFLSMFLSTWHKFVKNKLGFSSMYRFFFYEFFMLIRSSPSFFVQTQRNCITLHSAQAPRKALYQFRGKDCSGFMIIMPPRNLITLNCSMNCKFRDRKLLPAVRDRGLKNVMQTFPSEWRKKSEMISINELGLEEKRKESFFLLGVRDLNEKGNCNAN